MFVPADFESWLRSRPAETVVGQARDPLGDPLANFLTEREQRVVAVGYDAVCVGSAIVPLPDWARRYQRLLDRKPSQTPITARAALSLLWTVMEQTRRRDAWRAAASGQRPTLPA
jgi:hypothetical protein